MPPSDRLVPRFAAEPPQDDLPYGRWAERLRAEFLGACLSVDTEGAELGEPGDVLFYPDRSWGGRTYVPATCATANGFELYGHVSYVLDGEPTDLAAAADFTAETADQNPDWQLDLCEEVIGTWRGELGKVAQMTLVWGRPTQPAPQGAVATAELAGLVVDQCPLAAGRFTLVAPDDYRGDTLEVALHDRGREVARESLYEDDEE